MKKRELQQKLAALVTEERAQLERLQKEGRSLLGDEQDQYEKRAKDIAAVESEIQAVERTEAAVRQNTEREERMSKLKGSPEKPTSDAGEKKPDDEMAEFRKRAWSSYLRGGLRALNADQTRALSVGTDTEGGFLQAPQQFVNELLKAVDDATPLRTLARRFQIAGAESLGVPTLDTDMNDADWTSELATGSEDTATRFGKRELRPHPLAKRVKISNTLLRSTVMDMDNYVRDRLAFKFAVTQEKAFQTGTGTMRPLGVFTASADGIPTSRDVSTGNTTTSIGADGLIEAKHTLKSIYWPRARWLFHRDALKQIRKLKDGNGQYLWQPGLSADLPTNILEIPYVLSEFAPNTFTTGLYVGLIGDFTFYWVVDSINLQVQVLTELYAETNQAGYIGRAEVDGQPVLSEAFVRVKLA